MMKTPSPLGARVPGLRSELLRRETQPIYRTVQEVAELLGMSDKQVRNLIKREELPAFKFGREYRVNDEELATWIEDHRIAPPKAKEEVAPRAD